MKELQIRGANLGQKLDVITATLAAVREAHRDQMSPDCWAALHRAEAALGEATLASARAVPVDWGQAQRV